ncbi:putative ABC transporter permease protein [Gordonia polyisoprenivorans NBRC 16320 = JCM 10675]|uniref:ABC transporter permease n=1 Tax=Gordonia polyisoprenivorans TaxID=84595 RepID=A0A846WVF3_9ACTN|nr:ABC transporter permease [Gordonia polyisoprenivorans]NKY05027.1 ABC transporter permease [Gordonia polyisoprenivorans]WCB37625.1 ABC transporter permease [Gordonia polyisoprenivorans]GAB22367.1 putative ABC transporter permease protein [Gordonia polyisoprenivorans NBRC 16320 = JCM 10675]
MRHYILRRVGQAALVLLAAYTLAFLLLSALPGDAVHNKIADPEAQLTPEAAKTLLEYYGIDRPLWQQYLSGLGGVLHGDLGFSLTTGTPVSQMLAAALPATLQLTALALVFGLLIAAVVAVAINYAPWPWLRGALQGLPPFFASVPTFVIGILVLQVFSFRWHLIPASDDGSLTALIAPAFTLGILVAAPLSQVFASSIAATRGQPFVHVLAARGAGERYIFGRGVLRNSSLPVLTLLGLACGELIAGSVVTEAVYARAGLGQLVMVAVNTQDLPVVSGVVIIAAAIYVVANLLVDLAYPFLDPRILVTANAPRARRTRPASAPTPRTSATADVPSARRHALPAEVAMP